jgi:general secretion pathway protein G
MNTTLRKFARLAHAGFTLVELLIVVIILAILAAIVIPQFTSSTVDAQESALDSNLASMRAAIELFKVQHGNFYPGGVGAAGAGNPVCAAPGAVGTGAVDTEAAWISHLTMASDAAGNTCSVRDAVNFRFGPYLRSIPNDPIYTKGATAGDNVVQITGVPLTTATLLGGWKFDTRSGQVIMNSAKVDSKGVKTYSQH